MPTGAFLYEEAIRGKRVPGKGRRKSERWQTGKRSSLGPALFACWAENYCSKPAGCVKSIKPRVKHARGGPFSARVAQKEFPVEHD